jgi:hypothetical protein
MARAGGALLGAALEAPSPLRQPRRGGEKADPYSANKRKGYLGILTHNIAPSVRKGVEFRSVSSGGPTIHDGPRQNINPQEST